jgi:hypothetical protein
MKYVSDGSEIRVGDSVVVEGNVRGIVVCDFDRGACLKGYEGWLTQEELVGGGKLTSGVMVKSEELGLVHYAQEDASIVRDPTLRSL